MTDKIWKDVEGYEGLYKISYDGIVLRLGDPTLRGKYKKDSFIKPWYDKLGYLRVKLHKKGKPKTFMYHRILAIAFIPNPENKPCVNHENGLRDDCRIENLSWVTVSENQLHKYRVLKTPNPNKGKFGKDNALSKAILQFSKEGIFIKEWDCAYDVERELGIKANNIYNCALGRKNYNTAGGFIWKYKEIELVWL